MKLPILFGALTLAVLAGCEPQTNASPTTVTVYITLTDTNSEVISATETLTDMGSSDTTTQTDSMTVTDTASDTITQTDTMTATDTVSDTITQTDTITVTNTASETITQTNTNTSTDTMSETRTNTQTNTEVHVSVFEAGYVTISQVKIDNNYTFTAHDFGFGQDTQLIYSWDFTDGSAYAEGYEVSHQFDFTDYESYEVMLTVSSGEDQLFVGSGVTSEVCSAGNTATIKVRSKNLQTVELEGFGSNCYDLIAIDEYSWDFGDGHTVVSNEPRITYHFDAAGTYDVLFSYEQISVQKTIIVEADPAVSSCPYEQNYGPRSSVLLTADQYNQSVFDLTGVTMDVDYDINNVDYNLFLDWAHVIAKESQGKFFNNIISCEFLFDEFCAQKYLEKVLPVFYRQSLSGLAQSDREYDIEYHKALFEENTYNDAMVLSLASIFSSPQFLFNSALGEPKENILEKIEMQNSQEIVTGFTNREIVFEQEFTSGIDDEFYSIGLDESMDLSTTVSESEGEYVLSVYINYVVYSNVSSERFTPKFSVQLNGAPLPTMQSVWHNVRRLDIPETLDELTKDFVVKNNQYGIPLFNEYFFRIHKVELAKIIPAPIVLRENNGQWDDFEDGDYILSNWEVASLLSFNYLGSVPDQELVELAIEKQLDDPIIVGQQIDRLLASDQSLEWAQLHNINTVNISTTSCNQAGGE
ncbi:MAG: PKD domain-containing protein [Pseudomonadales bacterium]|nr:PKD domain-containing protein [Pseudomonadales bacterium]